MPDNLVKGEEGGEEVQRRERKRRKEENGDSKGHIIKQLQGKMDKQHKNERAGGWVQLSTISYLAAMHIYII